MENAGRRHRDSLPREATSDIVGVRGRSRPSSACGDAAARDVLAYWLALALAVGTMAAIYCASAHPHRACPGRRARQRRCRAVGGRRCRPGQMDRLPRRRLGDRPRRRADLSSRHARISPDAAFSVTNWTAYVIFIVVIGGIGRLEGPILGVLVFWGLQTAFADFGSWYLLALGLLAIAIMLFAPRGLWGLIADRTGLPFPRPTPPGR